MKQREEMLRDIHRRMDEYEANQRAKRAKITKIAASVTPVCAAAVVGVGLWKGGALTPHNDQLISSTVESTASDVILSADNDTPADKHSANNTNSTNKGNDTATEQQAAMVNTTIPQKTTETPTLQAGIPVQQTTLPVQQTEPATQSVSKEQTSLYTGENYMWCIFGSSIEWNGQTYHDSNMANISAYTQDSYIGMVKDFEGVYKNALNYRISPDDSVYTVKETADVLFVVKADCNSPYGSIIVMCSSNWSIEKYESERLSPNYNDTHVESYHICF